MFDSEDEWDALNMMNRMRQLGKPHKETKEEILKYHRLATKRQIQHDELIESGRYMFMPLKTPMGMPGFQTSKGWRNRRSPKEVDSLIPIKINNLKLGEVHKGYVVFGELCEPPMACGTDYAVYTIMKDLDNPDSVVKISFHSGVQSKTCKEALLEFPVGAQLGIQEPLFKVYMDGTTGIRVDNMMHVFGDLSGKGNVTKNSRTRWDPPRKDLDEQTPSRSQPTCQRCGVVESEGKRLSSCAACRNVAYCSSKCQKADWKQHKLVCAVQGSRAANSSATTESDQMFTKGFYCKDNDFKVARKPMSTTAVPNFRWSTSLWAVSPPKISKDGRTATNVQFETVFCSCSPFGGKVTTCRVKILEPQAESVALGVCLVKKGKIDQSWKFSSNGTKYCGYEIQPYGTAFGVGDVISVILRQGTLSFQKNGKDLGVCYSGFDEGSNHYYLRGYFAAGMLNGFPLPGKPNGGCMEILDPEHGNGVAGLGEVVPTQAQVDSKEGLVERRLEDAAIVGGGPCSVENAHVTVAVCRTCSKTMPRAAFSKRSWKNWKRDSAPPQCQSCAETVESMN